jgi:RND family efflux transporter MFP subunit
MSEPLAKTRPVPANSKVGVFPYLNPTAADTQRRSVWALLRTSAAMALAVIAGWAAWRTYMESPWTRDGTVRAYVVTVAPEVAGRIVELQVADNQLVHKNELLMVIDPINYKAALDQAKAQVLRTRAAADDAKKKATRRQQLSDLAASNEERETFASSAIVAEASYQQAVANADLAEANLGRTRVLSPVDGYVTNLQVQLGDFANVGEKSISIVDSSSFWVDGYFEESALQNIHEGDRASMRLLGQHDLLRGHVESVARGITIPNAQQDTSGLAAVNPVFTWIRLAQRVPVRIRIDHVPDGQRLVAGLTATVEIEPSVR